ncbi:MAG: hypothetical protein ACTSYG_07535 [Candidatus Heimdallarchaeota archaeon]
MKKLLFLSVFILIIPFVSAGEYDRGWLHIIHTDNVSCGEECLAYVNITVKKDFTFENFYKFLDLNETVPFRIQFKNDWGNEWHEFDYLTDYIPKKTTGYFKITAFKENIQNIKWGVPQINLDPVWYGLDFGWETVNDTNYYHLWNEEQDYYFNTTNGLHLANKYAEPWSKDEICLNYASESICQSTHNFTSQIINNTNQINLTLNYSNNIITYILNRNDSNLSISVDSSADSITWKTWDVDVGESNNDYLWLDEFFLLNESFAVVNNNVSDAWVYYGDFVTGQNIWTSFNTFQPHLVRANNTQSTITIYSNSTNFRWLDALCSVGCTMTAPSSDPDITIGGSYTTTERMTYSGTCSGTKTTGTQWYDGSSYSYITSSTNLSTSTNNPYTHFICRLGVCINSRTVTGDNVGVYSQRTYCCYGSTCTASGTQTITVNEPAPVTCDYSNVGSDIVLTGDSNDCYNFTSSNVVFDCDSYDLNGENPISDYLFVTNGYSNITVDNCDIYGYPQTFNVSGGENFSWINNTVQDGLVESSSDAIINAIRISNTGGFTFFMNNSWADTFLNNTNKGVVSLNENYVFLLSNVTNINISMLTINNWSGIYYISSEGFFYSRDNGQPFSANNINNFTIEYMYVNNTGSTDFICGGENINNLFVHGSCFDGLYYELYGNNSVIENTNVCNSPSNAVIFNDYVYNATINNISIDSFSNDVSVSSCVRSYSDASNINIYNINCYGNNLTKLAYIDSSNVDAENLTATNTGDFSNAIDTGAIKSGEQADNWFFRNTSIDGFNFTRVRSGAVIVRGYNHTYHNLIIKNGLGNGIVFTQYDDHEFYNTSISNVSSYDIYKFIGSNMTFMNSSYNKSGVYFASAGLLYNGYYETINVSSEGFPLSGANVSIYNLSGDLIHFGTTNAQGKVSFEVLEYLQTDDGDYVEGCTGSDAVFKCYTPHNATANSTDFANNFTEFYVNYSKTINIILSVGVIDPCTPPSSGNWTINQFCHWQSGFYFNNWIYFNTGSSILQNNTNISVKGWIKNGTGVFTWNMTPNTYRNVTG